MKLVHRDELPAEPVSHNAGIAKRLLAELPGGVRLACASFPPGECAPAHRHADLCEVFYFTAGSGIVRIDGHKYPVDAGSCLRVDAGESHEIRNTGAEPLQAIYFALPADG